MRPRVLPVADAYYTIFFHNISQFFHDIEERGKPFAFTLYPGGGFALGEPTTEATLARILGSPGFRGVIATQPITRDYLLAKGFCDPAQVRYIPGCTIARTAFEAPRDKLRYGIDKPELDICFVANRYTPTGADKGYDLFADAARAVCAAGATARFHVVGPFSETIIPLGEAAGRVRFYGPQPREFFAGFYRQMDIILSPVRSFVRNPGVFDGFPTAACVEAGLQAVAVFTTDELALNDRYVDGKEIVLVKADKDDIVARLLQYASEPARLAEIGECGRAAMVDGFSYATQIEPRLDLLRSLLAQP